MSQIPDSPSEFFTSYLPGRFHAVSAAVAGKSSAGALVLRVLGEGEWSMRLRGGELEVEAGAAADAVVQITMGKDDFLPVLVEGARLAEAASLAPEKQVIAFKALTIEPERAKLVRTIPGSMAFAITDGDVVRRVAITPGSAKPKLEDAECRLECAMADFRDMQAGKLLPMQLLMGGKIKLVGNAQIPMALSTVFM
jgi:putative sterol carrier protein